jgi:glycosyltransferase involved in cell wall biosynthesis
MARKAAVRVAHLLHGGSSSNIEQRVVELTTLGRDRDVDPMVLAFGSETDRAARGKLGKLESSGVPVHWLGEARGASWNAIKSIRSEMESFGAQVLHAHGLKPWLTAVTARVLRPRTAVMATFHERVRPVGMVRRAVQVAARLSAAVVACGEEVRNEIVSWAPSRTRVVTINNGVKMPQQTQAGQRRLARARLGLPQRATVIGYLGRLVPEEGPDLLLQAFLDHFRSRFNVHLVMVGEGALEENLRLQAQDAPNVHLLGDVSDTAALLPGLDIYAQPSLSRGRQMAMLEAMAAGLPTVAYALPAVDEIHTDGETALLVAPRDRRAFGQALLAMVSVSALRRKLGSHARTRAQHFSIESTLAAYGSLYRELARTRS